jgi:hypothetical protein
MPTFAEMAVGDQMLGLMVLGDFPSGALAMFTGPGELVFEGNTYLGAGRLLTIGAASSSAGDEKGGLTISLSGASAEIISLAENEDFQRHRIKMDRSRAVIYFLMVSPMASTLTTIQKIRW